MIMKNKILTIVSISMIFVPWTLYYFRTFEWALKTPVAEIMIAGYAAFMIFSGLFTIFSYFKEKVQNNLMKICLLVNSVYIATGIIVLGMMVNSQLIR